MKIEHIAVAFNSEENADRFFIDLLGMKKIRNFDVEAALMKAFFGIAQKHAFIRYESQNLAVEVIITDSKENAKDRFTHSCWLVENVEKLIEKANSLGFITIKVPRKNREGFYYFVRDSFNNLYEIKQL
ncbi:MAG: hypothetical protein GF383_07080 [Candidatus Lokiarchaeota archaeon]|nr:hypothetical protein [Candidatus Lokiarchaeota archaeon]MBD3339924.1 hypothetical protein [Candidatus Lokiarchaeota archaeon]